jgi:hypothetical protein
MHGDAAHRSSSSSEFSENTTAAAKGYGAFSASHIRAGDLVLQEAPLLLYPQASNAHRFCSHCLKDLSVSRHGSRCDSCDPTDPVGIFIYLN